MMARSRSYFVLIGVLAVSACSGSGEPVGSGGNAGGASAAGGSNAGGSASGAGGGATGGTGGGGGTTAGTAGSGGSGGSSGSGGSAGGSGGSGGSSGSGQTGGSAGNGDLPRDGGSAGSAVGTDGSVRRNEGGAGEGGVRDAAVAPRVDSAAVDPGTEGDGDLTLSTFTTQVDLTDRGAPRGRAFNFTMDSTKSVIFDGSDPTLQASKPRLLTRRIDVYIPAQYKDGTPAPIMVIQDGPGPWTQFSRAVDNLSISTDPARKVPAFVLIGVQNGGNDAMGSERGLEYDTMSDRYARFVQLEVLPAVLSNAAIKAAYPGFAITDDPEGKATYGCSSGGAAAFTMTWFRPDLFRRTITYSGTFVAAQTSGQPEAMMYPNGAWDYHSGQALIANTDPPKPIRAFINVNSNDNGATASADGRRNWVIANQRMAAALKAKNYHYRYVYGQGLAHCAAQAWQSTLADALVWMWRGYPTQ